MFWKKNKQKEKEKNTFFSLPEENIPAEIRGAFRVQPSSTNPVDFNLEGHEHTVVDISSGGLSFKNIDFSVGDIFPVDFNLPYGIGRIETSIEILKVDKNDFCRCRFGDLTDEQEDVIHRYVLIRQKEQLEEKKIGGG